MAMDYKHRVPGNRSRPPRRPGKKRLWVPVFGAAAVILVLWLIFQNSEESPPEPEPPKTTQFPAPPIQPQTRPLEKKPAKTDVREDMEGKKVEQEKKAEVAAPPPKPVEPRFSFYKILPEKEVIIPESEIKTIKREESLGNKPAGNQYLLQAGSFPNLADAEKLKAQLSKLKIKSKIESVKIENADWHRVKIGPFNNLVDADRVRVYLRSNQIDSVVQKATGK